MSASAFCSGVDRRAASFGRRQQHRLASVCRRILRIGLDKFVDRRAGRIGLAERQFERRLEIEQRRAARMLGQRLLDVPQRGPRLVAFDHAVNLFDVTDQIGAAELQLLAAAAGTRSIGINRHRVTPEDREFEVRDESNRRRRDENRPGHANTASYHSPGGGATHPRLPGPAIFSPELPQEFHQVGGERLLLFREQLEQRFDGSANLATPSRISSSSSFS